MKLLATFMMIAFAFASLTVATLNGAMATDADTVVALSSLPAVSDSCSVPQDEKAAPVSFRPCGKMVNGMAIICHPDHAVLPAGVFVREPPCGQHVAMVAAPLPVLTRQSGPFRPPRFFSPSSSA